MSSQNARSSIKSLAKEYEFSELIGKRKQIGMCNLSQKLRRKDLGRLITASSNFNVNSVDSSNKLKNDKIYFIEVPKNNG